MKKIVLLVLCFALLISAAACGQDKPPVTDPDTDGASETMTDAATEGQTGENETESESSGISYIDDMWIFNEGYIVDDDPNASYPYLYFAPKGDELSVIIQENEAGDRRYTYLMNSWGEAFESDEAYGRGHVGTNSAWFFKRVDPITDDDGNRIYNFCVTKLDRQSRSIEQHNFSLPVQSPTPWEDDGQWSYEWFSVCMPNENTWFISIFRYEYVYVEQNTMAYLAKTTDGGKSWEVVESGLPRTKGKQGFVGCYFFDENNGLFIVEAHGLMEVAPTLFTYDGGKSWEYIEMPWREYDPDLALSLEFKSCRYELPRSDYSHAGRMTLRFQMASGEVVLFYSDDLKNWKCDKWW